MLAQSSNLYVVTTAYNLYANESLPLPTENKVECKNTKRKSVAAACDCKSFTTH